MIIKEQKIENAEAVNNLIQRGTLISTKVKNDKIISIYFHKNEFAEMVFNTKTNEIEDVKHTVNPNQLNIFFEECSINALVTSHSSVR